MQIIIQPLPRRHLLNAQPRPSISQRGKKQKPPHQPGHNHPSSRPRNQQTLPPHPLPNRSTPQHPLRLRRLRPRTAPFGFEELGFGEGGELGGFDVGDEFYDGARDEGRGEVRGEVVVQVELAAHDEEGGVVRGPEEEEEACAVVEAGAGT